MYRHILGKEKFRLDYHFLLNFLPSLLALNKLLFAALLEHILILAIPYRYLGDHVRDPWNYERKNLMGSIDGIKIQVPNSLNQNYQKSAYYCNASGHWWQYQNICDADGKLVLFSPPSFTISPTHGDNRDSGYQNKRDITLEEDGNPMVVGFPQFLRGSDKHFLTMIGKRTFVE